MTDTSFQKKWQLIDSLITKKNLPKSALVKVNEIYAEAKRKNLDAQVIKALLYRMSIEATVTEEDVNKNVDALQKEIDAAKNISQKSILQMILANIYNDYLSNNSWQIAQRSKTINYKKDDIETWNLDDFNNVVESLYSKALQPAAILQQTKLEQYNAIIIKGTNTENLRPTLYDLLVHGALDYYKSPNAYITKPAFAFEIKDAAALGAADEFMNAVFTSKDSTSYLLKALQLFQQLMRFHKNDKDPSAFIDVNIERIVWVNENAVMDEKKMLYKIALQDITQHYTDEPIAAQAWYLSIKIIADKGDDYDPLSDTSHRYAYVNAKKMIEERLKAQPKESEGNANMQQLLQQIESKDINTIVENVNIPNQPFRMYVQYKNVNVLYGRILRLNDFKNFPENIYAENFWQNISNFAAYKIFTQSLPQTNDYQKHAVEIKIDALPVGQYIILASSGENFIDSTDKMVVQFFDVSNISYLQNGTDFFVLNRETGKPLSGIKVKIDAQTYDGGKGKYVSKEIATKTPDEHGFFRMPDLKNNNDNIQLRFYSATDTLDLKNAEYYNPRRFGNDDEQNKKDSATYENENARIYFFTDRSIYRPGQTVFFKGIAITKSNATKQPKLMQYADSIEIDLQNTNGESIDSVFIHLNEYGSFSGKFKLPENELTGEFSISTIDFGGDISFNVEEYKRPKFYIDYDTLKSTCRLGDTIKITGYAKAYAGNSIDGAQVKFNVQRNTRFIYDWMFWYRPRPRSTSQQIADGVVTTDANGKFEISFVAQPDLSVDKSTDPVFDFSVEASVTDINGETREKNTTVSVGYKSLMLDVSVPNTQELSSFKSIIVNTQNLAGQNVPAEVSIKIFPLTTPSKLYRERYWNQPDQYVMTHDEFEKYFPYDVYASETDYKTWQKKNEIVNDQLNTATTASYQLPTGKFAQGWYTVEAITHDKDGQEIKQIKYIQLYDKQSASLPSPQNNWSDVITASVNIGETAKMVIGSSASDVYVIQNTQKQVADEKIKNDTYNYFTLSNSKKQIELPVTQTDEGAGLYYAFVLHNRFYTGGTNIYIQHDSRDLNISYATYRDKTEPGSNETWTVKVSGSKGEKVAAELLTSMYDASLDQFKPQSWQEPNDIWPYYYTNNNWQGNGCFNTNNSSENYYRKLEYFFDKRYSYLILDVGYRPTHYKLSSPEMALEGKVSGLQVQGVPGASDEVVVTGYSTQKKKELTGSVSIVKGKPLDENTSKLIKEKLGVSSLDNILIVIDDSISSKKIDELNLSDISYISLLTGAEATNLYGDNARNGVIIVVTKEYVLKNKNKKKEDQKPQIRKNFNETAFFFPQLYADTAGNYRFSFTIPEALTQWKWMTLAHTKDLAFGYNESTIVTQKKLMVQPNAPRFMREGDQMEFTAKISNLSDSEITGQATLELVDATTNQIVDGLFQNAIPDQYFTAAAGQSALVKFPISIPFNFNKPLTWRIVAKSSSFSDGEENTLPVLTNRMLVTESLPLYMRGDTTKQFTFEKLLHNQSPTLSTQSVTVEYTSNPVWYAVQSLPYLIEYPYECAEQTFNRFYANALASYIANTHPKIKSVLDEWKNDTTALLSNLQKNEELKNVLLEETPWVMDAQNEAQQKKNIALLFDIIKIKDGLQAAIDKLKQMQMSSGGFPWFKGGDEDRYITQYILTGIGRLVELNAIPQQTKDDLNDITAKAVSYLDARILDDYNDLKKYKADLNKDNLSQTQIQYLYMRSYFTNIAVQNKTAYNYYYQQQMKFWKDESNYMKAMIGITLYKTSQQQFVLNNILPSVIENAVEDKDAGMYWKDMQAGYYWYQAPIEQQSLMIEFTNLIAANQKSNLLMQKVGDMQTWLLRNKQTTNWKTTKATADACFALLLQGNDNLNTERSAIIKLGNNTFTSSTDAQAGTGYFKEKIDGSNVTSAMANITVTTTSNAENINAKNYMPSWGAVYWQYFEDLDKITPAATPLTLHKKLFIEKNTDAGKTLLAVNDNDELHIGDKIIVRIELKCDRDMEYVHLKDMRAASMEPVNVLSEYKWQDGLGYYEATKDASTNFFISYLRKGTYVFEYPLHITHAGTFSVGIANIQCMYAPEFSSHSEGIKINVAEQ